MAESGNDVTTDVVEEISQEEIRICLFTISGELFAIPVILLTEILSPQKIFPVPTTPPQVLGAVSPAPQLIVDTNLTPCGTVSTTTTLLVNSTDPAGNTEARSATYTIDTVGPEVSVIEPRDGRANVPLLSPFILVLIGWALYKLGMPRKILIIGLAFFFINIFLSQSVLLIDNYKASRYVYLSDGGHFENLGLYEMVLRRCHFIDAPIANLYQLGFERKLQLTPCTNSRCNCYIGYVHMPHLGLDKIYGEGLVERIPALPSER